MFTGLETRLNKVNNIFTKAMKQYDKIVKAADDEVAVSKTIIETATQTINTAKAVKERATNAISGIKQIIGESV